MSSDIFDLDEEREEAQRTEQAVGSTQAITQASSTSSSTSTTTGQSLSPHLRVSTNPNLLSPLPQPLGPSLPQHRKHAGSFAATPSFPSPLAQAITVPPHSDTSSSGSQSSGSGGEEEKKAKNKRTSSDSKGKATTRRGFEPQVLRPRTVSPNNKEPSLSPTSTEKTNSRSTSPALSKSVTSGSLLTKTRRPDAANVLPPITTASPGTSPHTSPTSLSLRNSPTHSRRLTEVSNQHAREIPPPSGNQGRRRSGSHTSSLNVPTGSQTGSSPLAFGSPELYPADDEAQHRSSRASTSSPQESRDSPNILGLGLGTSWEATSNASSSSRSGSVKGKSKDAPSPRRERDRLSIGAMPISR
jgi:serine/threonine-protein kinase RIM15